MSLPPKVLIFAEDTNDAEALKELIRVLAPGALVKVLRDPPVLGRDTAHTKRIKMSGTIAAFARDEETGGRRVVVVAHRDCDAVEPAHLGEASSLIDVLRAAGVTLPVAATPAWEMEAWWMLFPAALAKTRGCWKPSIIGRNRSVGSPMPRSGCGVTSIHVGLNAGPIARATASRSRAMSAN